MNPLEQEIILRFEESRNAYNKAASLMKSGRNHEAELLLRQALTLYPREIFLDEDVEIDKSVLDSYDLLFSNIRERLEKIERDRELPPRLDSQAIKSLQDLIERNQGPAAPTRRPGMKTQAGFTTAAGMPMPAPPPEPARPALDLDEPRVELTHDQIIAELQAAARASADEPPIHTRGAALEEGAIDAFEISLDDSGGTTPVPAEEPVEAFDIEFTPPRTPDTAAMDLDSTIADEIVVQEDFGLDTAPEPVETESLPEPAIDLDEEIESISEPEPDIEIVSEPEPEMDLNLEIEPPPEPVLEPEPEAEPQPLAEASAPEVSVDLDADLDAALSALEAEDGAPPADREDLGPETGVDIEEQDETEAGGPRSAFDDLTPIPDREDAAPEALEVRESRLSAPDAGLAAQPVIEDVTVIDIPPLPEPPLNSGAGDTQALDAIDAMQDQSLDEEDVPLDGRKPGRGLMGFFDKIKSKLRKKPRDEFDLALAEESEQPGEETMAAEQAAPDAPVEAVEPPPAAPEPEPEAAPQPPPPQAQAPGEAQPGEEEALEDDAVVAEMVKIEEPRERKVHIQVYDSGRTARLLANVLVLTLFGLGLLIAYMLAKPAVQLHYAYSTAVDHGGTSGKLAEPSWSARALNLAWGIVAVTGDPDQRAAAAVKSASAAESTEKFQSALAAGSVSSLLHAGQSETAARMARTARSGGFAGHALNSAEFRSLTQAADEAVRQGKHAEALKLVEVMNSRLEDPAYPTPGTHARAVNEARRAGFLAMAHAAGAAINAGDAQKAFSLIEPALDGAQPDQALAAAFESLKAKIKAALEADAEAARQAQKQDEAQSLADMAARL